MDWTQVGILAQFTDICFFLGVLERCSELLEGTNDAPGYDVNQMDHENVSLLHWAAINNRIEIVK